MALYIVKLASTTTEIRMEWCTHNLTAYKAVKVSGLCEGYSLHYRLVAITRVVCSHNYGRRYIMFNRHSLAVYSFTMSAC